MASAEFLSGYHSDNPEAVRLILEVVLYPIKIEGNPASYGSRSA